MLSKCVYVCVGVCVCVWAGCLWVCEGVCAMMCVFYGVCVCLCLCVCLCFVCVCVCGGLGCAELLRHSVYLMDLMHHLYRAII